MKATVNKIGLAYDDHGMGMPVLFLHAFPLNRGMWKGQITSLLQRQGFRLVSLDWRGLGESEIDGDLSTMELLAADVVGLMDLLGMERAILCGISMGGYVAFNVLRAFPQRVSGLILANTKPQADTDEARAGREALAQLAETAGIGAVADLQIPRLLGAYTRKQHPEIEARVRRMMDAATVRGVAAIARGMALRPDASDLLAAIACPTLVLVGEQDALIPPELAHDYAARIPGAQFAVIPQAGHLSNLEQPEAFLGIVDNFLRAIY